MGYSFNSVYTGNTSYEHKERPSWKDQALCRNIDSEVFEVTMFDEMVAGEIGVLDWFDQQCDRLSEAQEICKSCPVKRECIDASSGGDRAWTVRGGYNTMGYLYRSGWWKQGVPDDQVDEVGAKIKARVSRRDKCMAGLHAMTPENTFTRSDDRSLCKACRDISRKRDNEKRRAARAAARGDGVH